MNKYLLLLALTLSLFAQTPKSFAALGDIIYNDVDKFEKLKELASMQEFTTNIDSYIASANATKKIGLALDQEGASVDGEAYLKALRKLSTEHDAIIVNSRKRFKEAIADEDSETINGMITIGVIDPEDYKTELMHYYEEFNEDQNLSSLVPFYNKYVKAEKEEAVIKKSASPAQRDADEDEASLKRMRAKQQAEAEALERAVNEEKERAKKEVLDKQKKELGIE